MNAKQLKQSRVQLFRDAANFKKTDRIPHFANVVTWKVFDAGYTLDQAMTNFDVLEESVVKFLDNYPVDGLMDVGIRNQFTVTEAFGEGGYYYYDENMVGIHDHAHCTVDTLQQYLDDPVKYAWEVILPKKYGGSWDDKGLDVWKKTFSEYMRYVKYILHMSDLTGKQYGLPSLSPNNPMMGAIVLGIEELFSNLLGTSSSFPSLCAAAPIKLKSLSMAGMPSASPLPSRKLRMARAPITSIASTHPS